MIVDSPVTGGSILNWLSTIGDKTGCMFSIGEFSKISGLTVKTLRHYHDQGLLVASHVDSQSGYRYYDKQLLERTNVIQSLKAMDCSLAEISMVLKEYQSDAQLVEFLTQKKQDIAKQSKRLKAMIDNIDALITFQQEQQIMPNNHQVQIKQIEAIQVISQRWQGRYDQVGDWVGKLYRAAKRHAAGPLINLYYDNEFKEENADIETCLPIKKSIKSNFNVSTLPRVEVVSLVHVGPYDRISKSYELLYEYANSKNIDYQLPIREIYLKGPGMIFKGNPEKYQTEIQLAINKS